jgi:hypothetical protein
VGRRQPVKIKWAAIVAVGLGVGGLLNALVLTGDRALQTVIAIGFLGVIMALVSSSADR